MKKRYKIFKWSAPLWSLLLAAVLVVGAAAWATWLIIVGAGSFAVTYAPPPQEVLTTITGEQCNVVSGAGVPGAPVVVTDPSYSIECPFSEVDDSSLIQVRFSLDNSLSAVDVRYTLTGPLTSCFDVFADPVTTVLLAGAGEEIMRINLTGNAGTLACAIANPTETIVFDFTLGE